MNKTKEQIDNLRHVLSISIVGPYAMFLSDEQIDAWADRFQKAIDEDGKKKNWRLQIATAEDDPGIFDWDAIKPEPKSVFCSMCRLRYKIYELLDKYPSILAIRVVSAEEPLFYKVFAQGAQKR